MAINYQRLEILSVSEGDLPTGYAAYIDGARYRSGVTGEVFDHRGRRHDLIWSGILLPEGVDASFADPEVLWTAMERAEIRNTVPRGRLTKAEYSALIAKIDDPQKTALTAEELKPAWLREDTQLAYSVVLALPCPFPIDQLRPMVEAYLREHLLPFGFICHVAIHTSDDDGTPNVHAHVLIATRRVLGTEVNKKIRDVLGRFASHKEYGSFLAEAVLGPDHWAAWQNAYFEHLGLDLRVDPKRPLPGPKVGKAMWIPNSDRVADYRWAREESRKAAKDPDVLLELHTENQATFTEGDLHGTFASLKVPQDAANRALAELQQLPDLVPLFDQSDGRFSGRFTRKPVRDQERRIIEAARNLMRSGRSFIARSAPVVVYGRGRIALIEHGDESERAAALMRAVRDHTAAGFDVIPIAVTPPDKLQMSKHGFPKVRTLKEELVRQVPPLKEGAEKWGEQTCLVINQADVLNADEFEAILCQAADVGARVVLGSNGRFSGSMGRGGILPALKEVLPRRGKQSGKRSPATSKPSRQPPIAALPSLAFAAPGERTPALRPVSRASSAKESGESGTGPMRAPRPWRPSHRAAGLSEIYNLSTEADCESVVSELISLPADELLTAYLTLSKISDSSNKPSKHPLAMLHRRLLGQLANAGIDGVWGRTDTACLATAFVDSPHSWKDHADLAPRLGFVDVRWLLAHIHEIDNADWRKLEAHMARFPKSVFVSILEGLDDLFDREDRDVRSIEDVRYAVSFARLQVWLIGNALGYDLIAKETGDDQVAVRREDFWSFIPSADRIRRGLRFNDRNGNGEPIMAATLTSTFLFEAVTLDEPTEELPPPIQKLPSGPQWLRRPKWSPFGDYGVNPDDGNARGDHYAKLAAATDEQRSAHQAELLTIFRTCEHLAGRAWVGVGLRHLASWYRKVKGGMPADIEQVDEEAQAVVMQWQQSGGSLRDPNPFQRARPMLLLWSLTRRLLESTDPARRLELAEQLANLRKPARRTREDDDLFMLAQQTADYLRLARSPDPLRLGRMMHDVQMAFKGSAASFESLIDEYDGSTIANSHTTSARARSRPIEASQPRQQAATQSAPSTTKRYEPRQ